VVLGILGNKIGMTQVFDKDGNAIPVTIIKSGPCIVTQIKSDADCGYNAIQLGYGEISTNQKKLTKPRLGHFSKFNLPPYRYLKEYRTSSEENYQIGQKFGVEIFKVGQTISVTGLTTGKGNTGNIKQHGFNRGAESHGSKNTRLQGSIGAGTTPGRVIPGKRMPGRFGNWQRTISGLEIIEIDTKENLLVIKGSIPGKTGNLVSVKNK
jgi:large subunit ribosomal protein L3